LSGRACIFLQKSPIPASEIREAIGEVLCERFFIHHVTVQAEDEPSGHVTEHGMDEHGY